MDVAVALVIVALVLAVSPGRPGVLAIPTETLLYGSAVVFVHDARFGRQVNEIL
jgi:hypothetical protein